MRPTMKTGTARTRARGTGPLAVVCRPSLFLNQPRPRASSHHRSHMAVVEVTMVSGHHRSHMAVTGETTGPITHGRNQAEQQACYVYHSVGHVSYNCPNSPSGSNDKSSNQATLGRARSKLLHHRTVQV